MSTIANLLVAITGDATGLTRATTQASASVTKLGATTTKSGNAITRTFSSAIPLAVAGGAAAIVAGVAKTITAASDLGEQVNRAKVTFEESAPAILAFGETTASSMGIANSAALEAASGFGAMFQSAGLAEAMSADMSMTMVQLAADLASFNNQDPSEMLDRLRSGLAGEAEPLRRFGIFLSEAAVQAEAVNLGLARQGQELTDAIKVQARYSLIMKQSNKAQGDFGRTVGTSLPNQMRVFRAELEDTAAEIGQALLPAALQFVKVVRGLTPLLKMLADNLDLVVVAGTALAAWKFLPPLLLAIRHELDLLIVSAIGAATALGSVIKLAPLAGLGLGGYTEDVRGQGIPIVERFADAQRQANRELEAQKQKAAMAQDGIYRLGGTVEQATENALHFGRAISKAGKEIKRSIIEELPAIVGTVTTMKETFSLSPAELVRITNSWAKIGRTIARDLRQIGRADLTPAMREAISALPVEMRHAYVEGNARQRNQIERSIRETLSIQDQIPALANQAITGGSTVGKGIDTGIVQGIESGGGAVTAAARAVVQDAINAAQAQAGIESPSKVMHAMGLDLMHGLAGGIAEGSSGLPGLLDGISAGGGHAGGGLESGGQFEGVAAPGGPDGVTIHNVLDRRKFTETSDYDARYRGF